MHPLISLKFGPCNRIHIPIYILIHFFHFFPFFRFVSSLVYYGLSLSGGSYGVSIYLSAVISAVVEFPAYVIVILVLDRVGRKFPLVTVLIISGLACLACIAVQGRKGGAKIDDKYFLNTAEGLEKYGGWPI